MVIDRIATRLANQQLGAADRLGDVVGGRRGNEKAGAASTAVTRTAAGGTDWLTRLTENKIYFLS